MPAGSTTICVSSKKDKSNTRSKHCSQKQRWCSGERRDIAVDRSLPIAIKVAQLPQANWVRRSSDDAVERIPTAGLKQMDAQMLRTEPGNLGRLAMNPRLAVECTADSLVQVLQSSWERAFARDVRCPPPLSECSGSRSQSEIQPMRGKEGITILFSQ